MSNYQIPSKRLRQTPMPGGVNQIGNLGEDAYIPGRISEITPVSVGNKSRKAKSLASLSAEFVRLVRSQKDETIDVMYAASMLNVEKRRIYDITNALIGANVLQKQGKSNYHWIGGQVLKTGNQDELDLASKRDLMEQECKELDKIISKFSSYLEKEYYNSSDVVLTTEEIVKFCQCDGINSKDKTIIAISASPGTDVYVTKDKNSEMNEIFLESRDSNREIKSYLLPSSIDNEASGMPEYPHQDPIMVPTTPILTGNDFTYGMTSTPMYEMDVDMNLPNLSGDFQLSQMYP